MLNGLYVNADANKPVCSMYTRGVGFYEGLKLSKVADITYLGAASDNELEDKLDGYDFIVFNYHHDTMRGISQQFISQIKIPIFAFILEMTKDQVPFCHWGNPFQVFEGMFYADPALEPIHPKTWKIDRIVKRTPFKGRPVNMESPVISTFGIPHTLKGIAEMAQAIDAEFEQATFRLRFPPGSHLPSFAVNHIVQLVQAARVICKKSITMEFSMDFLPLQDLLLWLNESDLNIFFFTLERDQQPYRNIPSVIDDAIAAKRPIAISNSDCMDYLTKYIRPYPEISLKESMNRKLAVAGLYHMWSPQNFAKEFDEHLGRYYASTSS
jgi:hypothetical protein